MSNEPKSLLAKLRKRFQSSQPERNNMDDALTPGGKAFRNWLDKRMSEDATNAGTIAPNQAQQVVNPTNPKDAERRKQLQDLTTSMMARNKNLMPGKTKDQSAVLNAIRSDPRISKLDPKMQQDINTFFLNPQSS